MSLFKLNESYERHPLKWWHLPLLFILTFGTIYIAFTNGKASDETGWQHCEGYCFGTIYHITYRHAKDLTEGINKTIADVDHSLSTFNDSSTISAINSNRSAQTDSRLETIIRRAQEICKATHGAFDITVAPLVNAWGFGFKNEASISKSVIDSLLTFVGMDKISLSEGKVEKADPRVMLDCNAIAKGYGVDAVSDYLASEGVTDYMVEIGGEVRVHGLNSKGKGWRIGINEPVDDSLSVSGEIQNVLEVSDISMATSGNYRNFYVKDNKKYAHTIDPHTGYPVQHTILSSTVLAKDCMTADAYATAFMVLGIDKAKEVLEADTTLKAYFIYSQSEGKNGVWHSPGLKLDKE